MKPIFYRKEIVMLEGIVGGLIIGWILSIFGVNNICIEVLQPFINIPLTNSHYYFVFGLLGCIGGLIKPKVIVKGKGE